MEICIISGLLTENCSFVLIFSLKLIRIKFQELNFKTKTPKNHSNYMPIFKKPIISKPINRSKETLGLVNDVPQYIPSLPINTYFPQNDSNGNSVLMQQSYYQNPCTNYLPPPNCDYPNECLLNYSFIPGEYVYPNPFPYFPTNLDQVKLVFTPNELYIKFLGYF